MKININKSLHRRDMGRIDWGPHKASASNELVYGFTTEEGYTDFMTTHLDGRVWAGGPESPHDIIQNVEYEYAAVVEFEVDDAPVVAYPDHVGCPDCWRDSKVSDYGNDPVLGWLRRVNGDNSTIEWVPNE